MRAADATSALFTTLLQDFLNLYGRERTHNDVAHWLHRVLHVAAPAKCDSARVAGCLEMYRTQGVWMPALRLAYQTSVAECFECVPVSRGPPALG